jgi:hypothetical protein
MPETNYSESFERPIFNVPVPISSGSTVVIMNDAFKHMLAKFIEEVDFVEGPIRAFAKAIRDPLTSQQNLGRKMERIRQGDSVNFPRGRYRTNMQPRNHSEITDAPHQ